MEQKFRKRGPFPVPPRSFWGFLKSFFFRFVDKLPGESVTLANSSQEKVWRGCAELVPAAGTLSRSLGQDVAALQIKLQLPWKGNEWE